MNTELQNPTHNAVATAQVVVQLPLSANYHDFIGLTDAAKKFATTIVSLAKASTESTVAMCETFYRAKNSLDDSEFSALCKAVNYTADSSTMKKFILIGEKAGLFRSYLDRLPNTWTTLYEITRIDGDAFQQFVETGVINPSTKGKDVKRIASKTKSAPIPQITLKLGASATRNDVNALVSLLEGLSVEYGFTFDPNTAINRLH